jgi:cellulose synthase/poly-beta-1,6-N-acetylglucosamine synthase-like glycosyltransferase
MEILMFIYFMSLFAILSYFIFYPLMLIFIVFILKKKQPINKTEKNEFPNISIIIVARNAEQFAKQKLLNTLSLQYPHDKMEILFYSDGSTDKTLKVAREFQMKHNIKILFSSEHLGKIHALNKLSNIAKGEILIFTDVDAILEGDCIYKLIPFFNDKHIGGICGKRVIRKKNKSLETAQIKYFAFSTLIQKLESQIHSVTSNEGKLYAIRKKLFKPILNATTDDLFVCLSIVSQHYRFIFDSNLKAFIPIPSRSLKHEITRRRRIVSTSLRGIFYHYRLFNVFEYGIYSINLFLSKVLKRIIPFLLITLLISNIYIYNNNILFKMTLWLQVFFYLTPLALFFIKKPSPLKKLIEMVSYFVIGNIGTFLGVIDFIKGKKIDKWQPEKEIK